VLGYIQVVGSIQISVGNNKLLILLRIEIVIANKVLLLHN